MTRRGAFASWIGAALPVAFLVGATWVLWLRFNAPPGTATSKRVVGIARQGDLVNYYVGTIERMARRLAAGEIPLWNPESCSGIPLLATLQAGVFYPGNWLALVAPAHVALSVLAFLHCALGATFAWWLFRSWGCGPFSAACCALLFVFKCCLGQILWPPAAASVVWLPWILLCVEKLCRAPDPRWWAGLALGCAVQILAGFPQYVLYTYFLVAPYAIVRLCVQARAGSHGWRRAAVSATVLGAAILAGVGVAGVQLAPTLELVAESVRSRVLLPAEVHYLNFFAFPHSGAMLASVFDPSRGEIVYEHGARGYLGTAMLLALAVAPVLAWRDPRTWLLLAAGAAALLLSDGYLGPARPLYEAYARLPFVGSLRSPERLRFVAFFCASGLAAIGLVALEAPSPPARRRWLWASALCAAAGVGLGMLWTGHAAALWRLPPALVLLLALGSRIRWLRTAAGPVLALFVAADLALATRPTGSLRRIPVELAHRFHTDRVSLAPEQLDAQRAKAGSDRLELVGFAPAVGAGPSAGLRRASCYEPLIPVQWAELHRRLTGRISRGATLVGLDPETHPTFYDVMSVRRLILPGAAHAVRAVSNDDALPRAFVIDRYRIADRGAAFEHVARGDLDFRRVVILDRDPGFPSREADGAAAHASRIVEDRPERVVVEAEAAADALLVLTDSHYPGWEARVDGERAEILLANGLHRAVAIPAGRHRVVFEYRPRSFRVGVALSLLSLAAVAAVLARSRRS